MSTMSFAQFNKALESFDPNLRLAQRKGIEAASLIIKNAVMDNLPASKMMKGVGRSGAKIGVRYDIKEFAGHDTSLVRAFGPVHLLEYDTKPHQMPKKLGSGSARKPSKNGKAKVKYVVIPGFGAAGGNGVFPRVSHPGTKGQHPWEKGLEKALPKVDIAFQEAVTAALVKSFGF